MSVLVGRFLSMLFGKVVAWNCGFWGIGYATTVLLGTLANLLGGDRSIECRCMSVSNRIQSKSAT